MTDQPTQPQAEAQLEKMVAAAADAREKEAEDLGHRYSERWREDFCALVRRDFEAGFTALAHSSSVPGEGDGAQLIAAERRRQADAEGWTPEHDDGHDEAELVYAAACYLNPGRHVYSGRVAAPPGWPWGRDDWKPSVTSGGPEHIGVVTTADRIRDLTKAGALLAAEIDRLQRKAATEKPETSTEETG